MIVGKTYDTPLGKALCVRIGKEWSMFKVGYGYKWFWNGDCVPYPDLEVPNMELSDVISKHDEYLHVRGAV